MRVASLLSLKMQQSSEDRNLSDVHTSADTRLRPAVVFIFITVALNMMAAGVIMPVLPALLTNLIGGDVARAARTLGIFAAAWALMQLLFSPLLGALSDRFGRRPVVLISNVALGLDYILMAVAPTLAWLFLGRLISGIAAASSGTAGAYIADVTPPAQRAAAFGRLSVAFGLGFILGPALGGLVSDFDPRAPFWLAAGLSLLNAAYGVFVLPESLSRECRSRFVWRTANPLSSLHFMRSHRGLSRLGIVSFLNTLAAQVLPSVFVIYAGYRYNLDQITVGIMLAGVGIANAVVSGTLVKPLTSRFGERRILLAGLLSGVLGLLLHGVGSSVTMFCLGIPAVALMGLSASALAGLMSRSVGAKEQGRLQGVNSSLIGITALIGPFLFTNLFAVFIGPLADLRQPGAPFLVGAVTLGAALVIAATIRVPREDVGSSVCERVAL